MHFYFTLRDPRNLSRQSSLSSTILTCQYGPIVQKEVNIVTISYIIKFLLTIQRKIIQHTTQASITNGDNDPPLVSDLSQYEITVRAIRTDPLTSRCSGDGLHLPADYQVRSAAIGPDYLADFLNYLKRKGWKDLFTENERQ